MPVYIAQHSDIEIAQSHARKFSRISPFRTLNEKVNVNANESKKAKSKDKDTKLMNMVK